MSDPSEPWTLARLRAASPGGAAAFLASVGALPAALAKRVEAAGVTGARLVALPAHSLRAAGVRRELAWAAVEAVEGLAMQQANQGAGDNDGNDAGTAKVGNNDDDDDDGGLGEDGSVTRGGDAGAATAGDDAPAAPDVTCGSADDCGGAGVALATPQLPGGGGGGGGAGVVASGAPEVTGPTSTVQPQQGAGPFSSPPAVHAGPQSDENSLALELLSGLSATAPMLLDPVRHEFECRRFATALFFYSFFFFFFFCDFFLLFFFLIFFCKK
jgi:hypothetical protein